MIPPVVLQEGTRNLLTNPLNEGVTNNWTVNGAGWTGGMDPATTDDGIPAFRATCTATSAMSIYSAHMQTADLVAGDTITVSCKVRSNRADARYYVRLHSEETGYLNAIAYFTPVTTGWTPVAITVKNLPATITGSRLRMYVNASSGDTLPGDQVWFVRPQVEEKPYATPFVIGTRPDRRTSGFHLLNDTHIGPLRAGRG